MPSFPDKIIIFGREFKVEVVDLIDGDFDLCGDVDAVGGEIRISRVISKDMYSTLLHEAIHSALRISGLYSVLGEDLEEAVCECIENALNPIYGLRE